MPSSPAGGPPGRPAARVAAVATRLRAAGCVFAEEEARLLIGSAAGPAELDTMVARRAAGEPVEVVVGWAAFCGLKIAVAPGVFVPRRRTECLARQAISAASQAIAAARQAIGAAPRATAAARQAIGAAPRATAASQSRRAGEGPPLPVPVIVDLCCGSGAVGAAVAAALGRAEVHAVDIDPAAVACARRNLAGAGGRAYAGDLYQPLPGRLRGRVDLLIANPPYVPAAELPLLPPEAREYEPRAAHDGGADGLDVLRRVAAGARDWLAPAGYLLAETSERQAAEAAAIVAAHGLTAGLASCAELGATVVTGRHGAGA